MLTVSIICIILTVALAVTAAVCLRGRNGCAVRSCASVLQLSACMAAVLSVMQMAQASIIYDNDKLNDKYITEGIDLYYLLKATAVLLGAVTLIATACILLRILDKRIKAGISLVAAVGVTVIAAIVSMAVLGNSSVYYQYIDLLLPVIPVTAWCLIIIAVNTLLGSDRLWQRILLVGLNIINSLALLAVVAVVLVMTNAVLKQLEINTVGVVLLSLVLLVLAVPGLTAAVSAARACLKNRRVK